MAVKGVGQWPCWLLAVGGGLERRQGVHLQQDGGAGGVVTAKGYLRSRSDRASRTQGPVCSAFWELATSRKVHRYACNHFRLLSCRETRRVTP